MTELSIIIPVYNAEKYLPACLDSVLGQSFGDFEVILVDDGSKDGSLVLINEWAQKDGRVKVFHKENGGVSSARNYGLSKASGEYICFVDSDDELPEGALEKLMARTAPGIDFVMGGYEMFDESGALTYSIEERVESTLSREDAVKQMYKPDYYIYWGFICSKLYKRSIIEKNNLRFDEDIFFTEDRLFTVNYLANLSGRIQVFTEPVYKYINRTSGAMTSMHMSFNPKTVTGFTAMVRMMKTIRNHFQNKELMMLAYDGIFESYSYIHNKMMEYGGVVPGIHRKLLIDMIKALPLSYLIRKKIYK